MRDEMPGLGNVRNMESCRWKMKPDQDTGCGLRMPWTWGKGPSLSELIIPSSHALDQAGSMQDLALSLPCFILAVVQSFLAVFYSF